MLTYWISVIRNGLGQDFWMLSPAQTRMLLKVSKYLDVPSHI